MSEHRRRPRYAGKNPRRFEEKYKELNPEKYPDTISKVLASGKTPAGSHVPILVNEILEILAPQAGNIAVDCTLGHGGHAEAILQRIQPGGILLGLDIDPVELPKTESRLRALGFGPETFKTKKSNFAGLPAAMTGEGLTGADCLLADLGVSSMQLDTPERGFSTKIAGPLDMRMDPRRGISAAQLLKKIIPRALESMLVENADEPRAGILGPALAGRDFALTIELSQAVRTALRAYPVEEQDKSVRRVFQALRIAINEELSALDTILRVLPSCLKPGGRAAILTFHSGEDRRVKKAFQTGHREGIYSEIADNVTRPSPEECRANPRATSAKLRWAVRAKG
ncbi:MAG: 16S rRNA (cytosine(1402)-N(4))-methyltransferase RsmH [Terrimicrobiaceae bacterium]